MCTEVKYKEGQKMPLCDRHEVVVWDKYQGTTYVCGHSDMRVIFTCGCGKDIPATHNRDCA